MFFWLTSLLTSVLFAGALGYLAFFNETLDAFLKVSLLFTLYFLAQLLPYVTELKVIYLIAGIGPLYIIVEAGQSVGLSIIIGEKVADWLSGVNDNFATDYDEDRERYGCKCRFREQLALIIVVFIYSISFWILFKVFMMESTNNWPISVYWVFGWIMIGMILIFITAISTETGTIVQTSMISLFLSYIIYCSSQVTSKELIANNNLSSNTTNWILQSAVVLIVLISIPPTMHDLDQIKINKIQYNYEMKSDSEKNENEIKTVFGKSTRLQSLIMTILVLLLTHVFQLWIDFKSLSVNLFWYRICEAVLSVLLYLFTMWREQYQSDTDYDYSIKDL